MTASLRRARGTAPKTTRYGLFSPVFFLIQGWLFSMPETLPWNQGTCTWTSKLFSNRGSCDTWNPKLFSNRGSCDTWNPKLFSNRGSYDTWNPKFEICCFEPWVGCGSWTSSRLIEFGQWFVSSWYSNLTNNQYPYMKFFWSISLHRVTCRLVTQVNFETSLHMYGHEFFSKHGFIRLRVTR